MTAADVSIVSQLLRRMVSSRLDAPRQSKFVDAATHQLYAGDTALHMAAAAFQREVVEILVRNGADSRAVNRRGAEPLHYRADTNHRAPAAQFETISYC